MNPASDPNPFGEWMLIAASVMVIVLVALQIIKHFKPSPPVHEKYATKDELGVYKEDVNRRFEAASKSRKDIHQKMDRQNERLARIEAQNDEQTKRIFSIDTKLDRLTEKLLEK